jgi:hypothetical protein
MITLRECLYNTIHRNKKPLKAIAEELSMSETYLTRAALPDAEDSDTGTDCRFPLKKLIPLIRATNDYSVLDCIEINLGRVAITLPTLVKASTADVCRLTMQSVKEFGHLIGQIDVSLSDNKITQSERDRIEKEGYEAVQAILSLMAACKGNGGKA